MIASEPQANVWLDIPNTCRISGEFTEDCDIRVTFGEPHDGARVVFERLALERFLHVALDLLATPPSEAGEAIVTAERP